MNFTHAKGVEIEKKNMSILATQLKHEELKRIHNGLACSDWLLSSDNSIYKHILLVYRS